MYDSPFQASDKHFFNWHKDEVPVRLYPMLVQSLNPIGSKWHFANQRKPDTELHHQAFGFNLIGFKEFHKK